MIVSVEELHFSFKKNLVFEDANLSISKPGIYGLVAPNGSGKTTLLHLLVDLYQPQKGKIELFDQPNKVKERSESVAFVQDNTVLFPYLSAYDHLKFICDMNEIDLSEIERIADFLDMSSYLKKKVRTYSLGMKQRLLLGMGLIKKPALLLLDEPLNGLDPSSTILMREALLESTKNGMTIVVSSHNLNEIDKVTNEVFFIKDKKIIHKEIEKLRQEFLYLHVEYSDIQASEALLEESGLLYIRNDQTLKIEVGSMSAIQTIKLFLDKGILPLDFDKEITGSENLYRDLFERGASV